MKKRKNAKNGLGLLLKYYREKIFSPKGILLYSPVPGERKSGIPALTDIPAPLKITTRWKRLPKPNAISSNVKLAGTAPALLPRMFRRLNR